MLLIALAAAQTVDAQIPQANGQLFRPSIDSTHTLWTDDSLRAPDGYFLARGVAHYARDPVIYIQNNDQVTRIVGDLFQLSLLGGFTKGPIRLGVDVPVYLRSLGSVGGESGLGDVSMDLKATALDRAEAPIGLALGARASLPTATLEAPLGNRGFGWELQGIVDKEVGAVLLAANLGVKGIPTQELENFTLGTQGVVRLGVGWAPSEKGGLSFDLGSHINFIDPVPEAVPVEGIVGAWGRASDLVVRGGIGTGLTSGFGAPSLRLILSFAYEPPRAKDTDGDGILDADDSCPTEPEDLDGIADSDGCPEPTMLTIQAVDPAGNPIEGATFALSNGTEGSAGSEVGVYGGPFQVSVSAAGHVPVEGQNINVPDAETHTATFTLEKQILPAKLTVNVVDPEGTAIPGASWSLRSDRDTVFEAGKTESLDPGTYNIRSAADGFRPATQEIVLGNDANEVLTVELKPAMVELQKERIDIKDSVYFETAKAVIKTESHDLLDEVAQIILDHPEIEKVRIEGHTDNRGAAGYNLELSKARAASVRDYLIGKGVSGDRLDSEGYGESKPIATGNNEAAWSKNRRVDFFVTKRSD